MSEVDFKVGDQVIWSGMYGLFTIVAIATGENTVKCIVDDGDYSYVAYMSDLEPYNPTIKLEDALNAVRGLNFNDKADYDRGLVLKQAVMDVLKGLVQNG